MSEQDNAKLITTVSRAADVLTLFTRIDEPTLGVTQIAQELNLSKAVVHRLLTTLAAKDYVQFDPVTRRYGLGPAVLGLGLSYLDRIDIRSLARQAMQQLSDATSETSTLSIRSGWTRVYVDQVTPRREVKMTVQLGRPFPLHAGSSSKAFLAFLSEAERKEYLAQHDLEALTAETITDASRLERELEAIRERGYAVSHGERQAGAASVAAPVFDHRGDPVASISVCGPVERFAPRTEEVAAQLVGATEEVSRQLGFAGGPR